MEISAGDGGGGGTWTMRELTDERCTYSRFTLRMDVTACHRPTGSHMQ